MKAFAIALAGLAVLSATPALADRYDGHRGDRYRDGGRHYDRGGYQRHGRDGYYRDRGRYAYRGDYRRGYHGPRGYYGRPYYRERVIIAPAYGYYGRPAYGYYGGYDAYPVRYGYGRGYHDRGYYRCRTSGGGTVLGAIAGGLIGNAVSDRYDRGAGTIVGAGIGAIAGTAIERDGRC